MEVIRMAYNPYSAIKSITDYKKLWSDAGGDTEKQNQAASAAQKYYDELIKSGAGEVAAKLKNSDYSGAGKILDSYGTNNLQETRPMVTNVLAKYGITADPAKFAFNTGNKNVSYDGHNLGAADYVSSEGKSYYSPDKLNAGLQGYINTKGLTPVAAWGDMAKGEAGKNVNTSDILTADSVKGFDPNSDTAKAILDRYAALGVSAGNNDIAVGGADNGGNIDSFAAANANRQKAAFTDKGMTAAEGDFNNRLNNIMSAIGIKRTLTQDFFGNSETEKTGNINRDLGVMGATGNVLPQYANPYIDYKTGAVSDMDFQAAINAETDPVKINQLKEARAYKIKNSTDPAINKLPFDSWSTTPTQAVKSEDKVLAANVAAAQVKNDATVTAAAVKANAPAKPKTAAPAKPLTPAAEKTAAQNQMLTSMNDRNAYDENGNATSINDTADIVYVVRDNLKYNKASIINYLKQYMTENEASQWYQSQVDRNAKDVAAAEK